MPQLHPWQSALLSGAVAGLLVLGALNGFERRDERPAFLTPEIETCYVLPDPPENATWLSFPVDEAMHGKVVWAKMRVHTHGEPHEWAFAGAVLRSPSGVERQVPMQWNGATPTGGCFVVRDEHWGGRENRTLRLAVVPLVESPTEPPGVRLEWER